MAAKRTTSGTQWSDADYEARGYTRLSLRLPASTKERLQSLAERSGWSIAQLLEHLSAAEERRREKRPPKKST